MGREVPSNTPGDGPDPGPLLDLAIVGAGPHALALYTRLLDEDPDASGDFFVGVGSRTQSTRTSRRQLFSQKRCRPDMARDFARRVAVIDPAGRWCAQWDKQFSALQIEHLRSTSDEHPACFDSFAMQTFADARKRAGEMRVFDAPRDGARHRQHITHAAPSADLFLDFCAHLVQRYGIADVVRAGTVDGLEHSSDGTFALRLSGDTTLRARRVVVATGATTVPRIPTWAEEFVAPDGGAAGGASGGGGGASRPPPGAIAHAWDLIRGSCARGIAKTTDAPPRPAEPRAGAEEPAPPPGPAYAAAPGEALRARLARFYGRHAPAKLDAERLDRLAAKYGPGGRADPSRLFAKLRATYGLPDEAPEEQQPEEGPPKKPRPAAKMKQKAKKAKAKKAKGAGPKQQGAAQVPQRRKASCGAWTDGLAREQPRVLIVGGGLTALHLLRCAVRRHGARRVRLVAREHAFNVKQFDIDLPWVGWSTRPKLVSAFLRAESFEARLAMLRAARGRGSVTPEALSGARATLAACAGQDGHDVRLDEGLNVEALSWQPRKPGEENKDGSENAAKGEWAVEFDDGSSGRFDRVWLCTGSELDVRRDPLLGKLLARRPIGVVGGLPALAPSLRWDKRTAVYVMGAFAALQLGPDALNLAGSRTGAARVAYALRDAVRAGGAAPAARRIRAIRVRKGNSKNANVFVRIEDAEEEEGEEGEGVSKGDGADTDADAGRRAEATAGKKLAAAGCQRLITDFWARAATGAEEGDDGGGSDGSACECGAEACATVNAAKSAGHFIDNMA